MVRHVVLKHAVDSLPTAADFEVVERQAPIPGDGWLTVRSAYQSLDPYIGSRLRGRHMGEPAPAPGEDLPGFCVGEVMTSGVAEFSPGDVVVGEMGWTEFGRMWAGDARKVDPALPLSTHVGLLGMPGLTAWAGVTQLAKVGAGDIFTVDAAAGPVGGTAGQIARLLGARVVGVAGGAAKCALVRETYGFDAVVDYRQEGWIRQLADQTAPGATVHFENVGLSVLMPVMQQLQLYGRVVLCGLAEHYHADSGPAQIPLGAIVGKRAQVLGLVVYDFYPRLAEWVALARPWLADGSIVFAEDIGAGVESAPLQFERLMRGQNQGKALVRMGDA